MDAKLHCIVLSPCAFIIISLIWSKLICTVAICVCRRRKPDRGHVSATWRGEPAATASTCTVRSPNRASSSEPWMKTLQHREQASEHRTRSSRYRLYSIRFTEWFIHARHAHTHTHTDRETDTFHIAHWSWLKRVCLMLRVFVCVCCVCVLCLYFYQL